MAWVEKRSRQKRPYRVRYRAADGRERSRSFKRRADADAFASTVETDILQGTWTDPALARTTYGEWATRWLATLTHLKPKTAVGYESLLRTHLLPAFGEVELGRLDPLTIREWAALLHRKGLSPSRIRQAYQLLSASFAAAVEAGYLPRTPCVGIKLPRQPRREMRFLSAEEVVELAHAVSAPYGTLIYLLAYGGVRWGEAIALRRRRCELLRSRIEIAESLADVAGSLHFGETKTYQRRTIVIPEFLRQMLADHLGNHVGTDPDALVFTTSTGTPLRHSNFRQKVWLAALARAGLSTSVRIHDLRHTCAALLISQGAHPKKIQVHLGHSSITVSLDLYGHLYPDEMQELADRLDDVHKQALRVRQGRVIELPRRAD